MKKFFSAICFLLIFAFVFSGCASVHYSFIVDSDGKISIGFEIDLDKTAIEAAGYDYQEAKNEIYEKVENIVSHKESEIFQYCLNTHQLPSRCGIKIELKEYEEKNAIYAIWTFESKKVYKEYNTFLNGGIEEDEEKEDDLIKEEHYFYTKVIEKVKNPFYDAINQSFVGELLNYFAGDEQKQSFTLDDVEYNYYYGMPESKLYSNSTYFFYQSGVKIHQWNFETTDMENDIEFYTIQIKPVAWYLLALSLTGIFILVMAIIVFVNKKLSKDNSAIISSVLVENGVENSVENSIDGNDDVINSSSGDICVSGENADNLHENDTMQDNTDLLD